MTDHIAEAVARLCADGITDKQIILDALMAAYHATPAPQRAADLIVVAAALVHVRNDLDGERQRAAARRMVENRQLAADGRAKQGKPPL